MSYSDELIKKLESELHKLFINKEPKTLYEAMAYSVEAGGKRLRPVLLLAACDCVGGNVVDAMPFACAIELIHTYSLIHDDLPSMDNDDLRRGRPTSHVVYGEAMAILAGDGLLNMAYEIMSKACAENVEVKYVYAMKEIAAAAGAGGMVGGQAVDILSEGTEITENTLEYMHNHKTGSLIRGALVAGAIIGGADEHDIERFSRIGELIGFAFQVKDDILDYLGNEDTVGKSVKSDEKNEKTTYVSLYGIEQAMVDFEEDMIDAVAMLKGMDNSQNLIEILERMRHRNK